MFFRTAAFSASFLLVTALAASAQMSSAPPSSASPAAMAPAAPVLAAVPPKMTNGVLADAKGMTLYTYDKDTTAGTSACTGGCAANWPPFLAAADAKASGKFTFVTRADGAKQWAYDAKPLYLWKNDAKPGDQTGNGAGGNWHVVSAAP